MVHTADPVSDYPLGLCSSRLRLAHAGEVSHAARQVAGERRACGVPLTTKAIEERAAY